jgi:hypothetical protein
MKRYRAALLMLGLTGIAAGCDITDLDINTDPDAATGAVAPNLLFPTALVAVASNRTIEIGPGNAFHSQVWASNGSTGVFNDPDRAIISEFTAGNFWNGMYSTSLRNLRFTRENSLAQNPAWNNGAVQADIMRSYIFWMLTSLYETIPYRQAGDAVAFPTPEFDSQETVLRGIVAALDSAVARIDSSPAITTGDLLYGGNMENWRRFANSLKLRTLMMIRNRDQTVDAQITAVLGQPLIRENNQQAQFPFFTTTGNQNNLFRLNELFGGFTNAGQGQNFIFAGAPLVDLMNTLEDPRRPTYFALAVRNFNTAPDGGGVAPGTPYRGQVAGRFEWNSQPISMISRNIFRADFPNRAATAAETWFYEAEFRARRGELAQAHTAYVEGVRRALSWFNGQPGAIATADQTAYIARLPQSFGSQQQALEAIWTQQYIEVFDRAPENWTQWRRVRFPALPLPEQSRLTDIARRYPIPPAELQANPNAPQGRTLADATPMWFEPR